MDFKDYLGALQKAIYFMSWDAITELTKNWSETLKKTVWGALSYEDKGAMESLDPKTNIGRGCLVKSGKYAGQQAVVKDYIEEDSEYWCDALGTGASFCIRYSEVSFDYQPCEKVFGKFAIGDRVEIIDPDSPEYLTFGEITYIYDDNVHVLSYFVEFPATASSSSYGTMFTALQIRKLKPDPEPDPW